MIPPELKFTALCICSAIGLVLVIWVLSKIEDEEKDSE